MDHQSHPLHVDPAWYKSQAVAEASDKPSALAESGDKPSALADSGDKVRRVDNRTRSSQPSPDDTDVSV